MEDLNLECLSCCHHSCLGKELKQEWKTEMDIRYGSYVVPAGSLIELTYCIQEHDLDNGSEYKGNVDKLLPQKRIIQLAPLTQNHIDRHLELYPYECTPPPDHGEGFCIKRQLTNTLKSAKIYMFDASRSRFN